MRPHDAPITRPEVKPYRSDHSIIGRAKLANDNSYSVLAEEEEEDISVGENPDSND